MTDTDRPAPPPAGPRPGTAPDPAGAPAARPGTAPDPARAPADRRGTAPGHERPIRLIVLDDHPVVREGLRAFLTARGFEVVGEAGDGETAVRLVHQLRPDVLLTDLVVPGEVDGIEVIRRLRSHGVPVGILVLTSFSGSEQVVPAIQAGADGYLLKDAGPAALEDAIRAVHRGESLLAPEAAAVVMARVAGEAAPAARGERGSAAEAATTGTAAPAADHPDLARLTPREREVLAGLGRGLSNRQLAADLFVSEKTVKTHVSNVLAKLRVADRTQAALFAVRVGLADPRR